MPYNLKPAKALLISLALLVLTPRYLHAQLLKIPPLDTLKIYSDVQLESVRQNVYSAFEKKHISKKDSMQFVINLNRLAHAYYARLNYSKAGDIQIVADRMYQNTYGTNSIEHASSIDLTAAINMANGKYAEAKLNYLKELEIIRILNNPNSPPYTKTLNNLANLYVTEKKIREAEPLYNEAISLSRQKGDTLNEDYCTALKNLASIYAFEGQTAGAERLYVSSTEINKIRFGQGSIEYAMALNDLGSFYLDQSKFSSAGEILRSAKKIADPLVKHNEIKYAMLANNLAAYYRKVGQYAEAEPLYNLVLNLRMNILGQDDKACLSVLSDLASLYEIESKFIQAESLYAQVLAKTDSLYGKASVEHIVAMRNAINFYLARGSYKLAAPLCEMLIEMTSTLPDSTEYAACLTTCSKLYIAKKNYSLAESDCTTAARIIGNIYGVKSSQYASSLENLVKLYIVEKKYHEALNLYNKLIELSINNAGKDSLGYAATLSDMADCYAASNNYTKAELLYFHALSIRKKSAGQIDRPYAYALSRLALIYTSQGKYADAELRYNEARKILENLSLMHSPEYAAILNNLAALYKSLGKLNDAEELYLESLNLRKNDGAGSGKEYATTLNNLAGLYEAMGNPQKAEVLFRKTVELMQNTTGKNSAEYATAINNLAGCLEAEGRLTDANGLYKEALTIRKSVLGEDDPDYANSLNYLAGLNVTAGHYAEAESEYKDALTLIEKLNGKATLGYATTEEGLAKCYVMEEKYSYAEPLYKHALKTRQSILGTDNVLYGSTLENLAILNWTKGNTDSLIKCAIVADRISVNYFKTNITGFTEDEVLTFKKQFKTDLLPSLSLYYNNDSLRNECFNSHLILKGVTLNIQKNIYDLMAKENSDDVKQLFISETECLKKMNSETRSRIKDSLQRVSEEYDRQLKRLSSKYNSYLNKFNISVDSIRSRLSAGECAIDITRFNLWKNGKPIDSTYYAAFIVQKNKPVPTVVKLFSKQDIVKLLYDNGTLKSPADLYVSDNMLINSNLKPKEIELHNLLWKPLKPFLKGIKTIYYSPDGVLNNINIAGLGDMNRIVNDSFNIKSVISLSSVGSTNDNLKLTKFGFIGGLQYNSSDSSCQFPYIKESLDQVAHIKEMALNKGKNVLYYLTDTLGTVDTILSISKNPPDVLLFATHGFYHVRDTTNYSRPYFYWSKDAMDRSGLAVSCNTLQRHSNSAGVITSKQISVMDLSKTKLVVLAACESGRGVIESGEGVFGLQRAFKKAGVEYILMSQSKVGAGETNDFMTYFFGKLMESNKIEESFESTQKWYRQSHPNSVAWAQWVLVH